MKQGESSAIIKMDFGLSCKGLFFGVMFREKFIGNYVQN